MRLKKITMQGGRHGEQLALQSMVLPGLVLLILFSYGPMWGVLMAFQEYDIYKGFLQSPWVGLKQFISFFQARNFRNIMVNTVSISFLKLLVGFPAPILFALLLNEVTRTRLKRVMQTISYLPHFLSWVIVSGMVFSLLSTDNGSVNILLQSLGIINEPVNWLARPDYFWTILITANVWKGLGFGSIIYLAAISGVNPELYEAAVVDGAGRLRCALHITLPSIVPQIIILLILSISNILNAGFEDIMLLTNNGNNAILNSASEVIDIHVYKMGVQTQRYSYATAVGLFKSVINIAMLLLANTLSRVLTETSLW